MNMQQILESKKGDWLSNPAASEEEIRRLLVETKVRFSEDYLEFLKISNGAEASLNINPFYFIGFSIDEVIAANQIYHGHHNTLQRYPHLWAFGTNGGGELFVFDIQEAQPWKIYCVPAIGDIETDTMLCTDNFLELVKAFEYTSP